MEFIDDAYVAPPPVDPKLIRLRATMEAARYHGVELDPKDFRGEIGEASPSPATLVRWLEDQGLVSKAMRIKWKNLVQMRNSPPVVLMFQDGSAGLLVGADPTRDVVWLRDPMGRAHDPAIPIDSLRLAEVWTGDIVLVRRKSAMAETEAPINFHWLARMVVREKRAMRDIAIASMILSVLTIIPPLVVMQVIDKVVNHHSLATLASIATIIVVFSVFEAVLSYARRELVLVLSTRLDSRIGLLIFNRLVSLPLDYFERHQAGQVISRITAIYKVRDFMTGKLMATFLDMFTLLVILPFLFVLSATLAWMTLAAAVCIGLIVFVFIGPVGRRVSQVIRAETHRSSVLYESVAGVRTMKTLALEPGKSADWDERTAEVGKAKLAAGRMSNIPSTLVMPLEMFISRGVILVGAYFAATDVSGLEAGGLIAFMMLGGRVAAPLVGMAKLLEDLTDMRAALAEVGLVLNTPTETKAMTTGMRPPIHGALSFSNVDFVYPGSTQKALDGVSFQVPAGTILGVVGRSGSGKSTLTRLLQGVSREYEGFVKLDGIDLRDINLTHLRRSLGVVLQDNFLYRGSIRDNITANRPGLTQDDVVRAARLAGAEEFIERMPGGYETLIEEGSTNISGGQRQRLAIARALISDPRLMILDEATSALDPESEALVNENLRRIGQGRTMVIVSHRLSSLVDCDQILVLDRGVVVDIGTHYELLERCTIYRLLWLQQNRHTQGSNEADMVVVQPQIEGTR